MVEGAARAMEVVPPRTSKGAATRQRLLAAASRLFAEQGYGSTSVETIAHEAGITVPGMYKHFPNKASVLMEVARAVTITSSARRALTTATDLPRRLGDLFAEYTAEGQIERRRLSIELSRASYQNAQLGHALISYNSVLRESLRDTLVTARPVLADGDEGDLLAHLLLVLLMGAIHLDTLDAELIGDDELIGFLVERMAALLDAPTATGPSSARSAGRTVVSSINSDDVDDREPADGRHRRSARTRRRIFDAATELFALHGYDGTTTEMIAAKAAITVPGLYLHVASKEELLVEIGRRTFTGYRMARPLGGGGDPVGYLAALAGAYSSSRDHIARRLAIELDFGAWRNPVLAQGLRESHLAVRANIARSLEARGPDGTPRARDLAATTVLMLFMGIAHLDTVDPILVDDARWRDLLHRRLGQLIG
jgi:AcrR family transcriptional regulator